MKKAGAKDLIIIVVGPLLNKILAPGFVSCTLDITCNIHFEQFLPAQYQEPKTGLIFLLLSFP